MRAYIVQAVSLSQGCMHEPSNVGIYSSKKHAIAACANYLDAIPGSEEITHYVNNKHSGGALSKNFECTYQMYFVNQAREVSEVT